MKFPAEVEAGRIRSGPYASQPLMTTNCRRAETIAPPARKEDPE